MSSACAARCSHAARRTSKGKGKEGKEGKGKGKQQEEESKGKGGTAKGKGKSKATPVRAPGAMGFASPVRKKPAGLQRQMTEKHAAHEGSPPDARHCTAQFGFLSAL